MDYVITLVITELVDGHYLPRTLTLAGFYPGSQEDFIALLTKHSETLVEMGPVEILKET